MTNEPEETGRVWAVASYASFFVGLPLFIGPLLLRNDAFALHHAKQAAVAWGALLAGGAVVALFVSMLSFFTCGIGGLLGWPAAALVPLWPIVIAAHGTLLAATGDRGCPVGTFGLGDLVFGGVTAIP